jgi:hypothetical protein
VHDERFKSATEATMHTVGWICTGTLGGQSYREKTTVTSKMYRSHSFDLTLLSLAQLGSGLLPPVC